MLLQLGLDVKTRSGHVRMSVYEIPPLIMIKLSYSRASIKQGQKLLLTRRGEKLGRFEVLYFKKANFQQRVGGTIIPL